MQRTLEPSTPPLPSERLRVGECVVDVPLREIRAPGKRRPLRITPKSMGVLLVLVEQAGRVVSRDSLMTEVWPDTLPTNDVVTQAITQLRKAFDDERGNPRYIETIAKNGYRLLAPIEWIHTGGPAASADVVASDERWSDPTRTTAKYPAIAGADPSEPLAPVPFPASSTPRGTWTSIASVIFVVALLVAGLVAWALIRAPAQPEVAPVAVTGMQGLRSERPYRLITSAPGFELSPALSPDAGLVAYVAIPEGQRGTAIMVQTTEQTQPRQLTRPPEGTDDASPVWSPDGRWIAFMRLSESSCSIRLVTPNARAEHEVGVCDRRSPPTFDWTPDSNGLIFGSMSTDQGTVGLRVLNLDSGQWQPIEYPHDPDELDTDPRYSPDGRWIVFVRNAPLGDFWRIPAQGGNAERLSRLRADLRGWDWSPTGRGLLFSAMVDGEYRLFRLDTSTGEARQMGVDDGQAPVAARSRRAIAFVQRRPYFGLYRVQLADGDGPGRVHVVEPLFASAARDLLPSIAPDGRQLAFVSDRSGSNGLWVGDVSQPDTLRMMGGVRPGTRYAPAWSPDSRRLLATGIDAQGRGVVQEVLAASGQVSTLPVPDAEPLQAQYSVDPNRLFVLAASEEGAPQLRLYDRSATPWRVLGRIDGVSHFEVDGARNRVLFTRLTEAGLWEVPLDLGAASVRQVSASVPTADRYRMWTVAPDGEIRYLERLQDCAASLRRIVPADPAPPRCLDQLRRSAVNGFSLGGPRNEAAYLALVDWDGADIGYMELPKETTEVVPGWVK
ncbi:DNA-binding winged helix-turn-helix (wHTH) protein/Tol biopolymer transport system component [Lysobacter sp. OAE881]|uniref:winged helix-turn-helix domain-containing protein n=1 Tax=Lysobacter sp. OAE881 TaxID=2663813 RepID=UPI00178A5FDA